MSILQKWINFWNKKVRQFNIWDLKYAQIWTAAWILLIVKLFPQIMRLSVWWFVAIIVILAPYLIYILLFRTNVQSGARE